MLQKAEPFVLTQSYVCQVRSDAEKRAASLDAGLRRVCTPKRNSGKLDVAPEVYAQWKKGGLERKMLLQHFVAVGANKDCHACGA